MVLSVLAVEVGLATHVGRVREINEDSLFTGERLFVVADGMGGHAAGDVASRTALDVMSRLDEAPVSAGALRSSVATANRAVVDYGRAHPGASGLGTTLAGVALVDECGAPHWAVFSIGDSRVYRLAEGSVRQITVDHSEVQELVAAGVLTRAEARVHPSRHIITRALGELPEPELDVVMVPATGGERWLITTDGLTSEVTDTAIAGLLAAQHGPSETASRLIDAALMAGGRDNISVIVVDVRDCDPDPLHGIGKTIPRPGHQE